MLKIPLTLANRTRRLTVNQSMNVISGERFVKFRWRLSNALMSSLHGHHFQVKLGKIVLMIAFSMLLVDHTVSLGYTLKAYPSSPLLFILPSILHLTLASYLLALTSVGLTATTVDEHWPMVVHIASLSLLSTVAQPISLLAPNDGTIQISQNQHSPDLIGRNFVAQLSLRGEPGKEEDPYLFWYTSLLLSAIAMIISATMPLGPPLYFPPERVYTLKSIEIAAKEYGQDLNSATAPNERKANVTGLVGSSLLGILLFDYSTKVVMLGTPPSRSK